MNGADNFFNSLAFLVRLICVLLIGLVLLVVVGVGVGVYSIHENERKQRENDARLQAYVQAQQKAEQEWNKAHPKRLKAKTAAPTTDVDAQIAQDYPDVGTSSAGLQLP